MCSSPHSGHPPGPQSCLPARPISLCIQVVIVPPEFVSELVQTRGTSDPQKLNTPNLGEIRQRLRDRRLAEARMMRTARVDPSGGCQLEIGSRNPYSSRHRQLGQWFSRWNHIDLIDDHAKSIPKIDQTDIEGRPATCVEH